MLNPYLESSTSRLDRLALITKVLQENDLPVFVIDGALLGLIRDGKLIEWDWDAELAILEQDFDLTNIHHAIEALILHGFQIKSVNASRYFKLNFVVESDPDFVYSIFELKKGSKFYVRPRYRYPIDAFGASPALLKIGGVNVSIPTNYELLLNFVYGDSWRVPINSKDVKNYLYKGVFRWGKLDFAYRIFRHFTSFRTTFSRFMMSESIFGREPNLRFILRSEFKPRLNSLIEIGSSDGAESVEFVNVDSENRAYIFEARPETAKSINQTIRDCKLEEKIRVENLAVVASLRDSRFFKIEGRGNLSSVRLDEVSESRRSPLPEVTFLEILEKFKGQSLLLKMDLEGYEIQLIQSAVTLLSDFSHLALLVELHQDKYDTEIVTKLFATLQASGFRITIVESALDHKPVLLSPYLYDSPLRARGKRALWRVKETSGKDFFQLVFGRHFVINRRTNEYGTRLVRTIVLTKDEVSLNPKKENVIQMLCTRFLLGKR